MRALSCCRIRNCTCVKNQEDPVNSWAPMYPTGVAQHGKFFWNQKALITLCTTKRNLIKSLHMSAICISAKKTKECQIFITTQTRFNESARPFGMSLFCNGFIRLNNERSVGWWKPETPLLAAGLLCWLCPYLSIFKLSFHGEMLANTHTQWKLLSHNPTGQR